MDYSLPGVSIRPSNDSISATSSFYLWSHASCAASHHFTGAYPVRVLFDHQCFILQKFGGVTRYYVELARNLSALSGFEVTIAGGLHVNEHLEGLGKAQTVLGARIAQAPFRGIRHLNAAAWLLGAAWRAADIYHPTYYDHMWRPRRGQTVLTFFDMIAAQYSRHADDEATVAEQRKAVQRADKVICISANTQRDLINTFGCDRAKTTVIHLGISEAFSPGPAQKRPEILFVGRRGWYKDFDVLKRAYEGDERLWRNYALVCFGGGKLKNDDTPRHGSIRWLEGNDEVLVEAYRRAAVFVFPSRCEGFGFPLLEALASGCPVVATRGGALEEIGGRHANYFTAGNAAELADVLVAVAGGSRTPVEVVGAVEYARSFTWRRCAEQTAAVYRELAALSK